MKLSAFARIILLLVASVAIPIAAFSSPLPIRQKIVGGDFTDPRGTPLAFISLSDGSCSGTLVSSTLVLTAAHCLHGRSPSEVSVWVNAEVREANALYVHGEYQDTPDVLVSNEQYDLGMIVLASPITSVAPSAVLSHSPNRIGDIFLISGFGINETTNDNEAYAKFGWIRIREILGGIFESAYSDLGAAACSGDSGGPAHYVTEKRRTLAGVLVYSSTSDFLGYCQVSSGYTGIVDLQSTSSRSFLNYFTGLKYTSGNLQVAEQRTINLNREISKALREPSLKRAKSKAAIIASTVHGVERYADRKRLKYFAATRSMFSSASKARNIASFRSTLKKISSEFTKIVRLGVS